ncbi:hypothetical protein O3P69_006411 [Scylla paramamosain]|uniref:Uncharacterized protein n=1 Tax=Scylla paramamosain TaxID=85552 RepID=A0AAW0U4I3_SCYPA
MRKASAGSGTDTGLYHPRTTTVTTDGEKDRDGQNREGSKDDKNRDSGSRKGAEVEGGNVVSHGLCGEAGTAPLSPPSPLTGIYCDALPVDSDGARGRKDRSKEAHLRPGQHRLQITEECVRNRGVTGQDMLAQRLKVLLLKLSLVEGVPCSRLVPTFAGEALFQQVAPLPSSPLPALLALSRACQGVSSVPLARPHLISPQLDAFH